MRRALDATKVFAKWLRYGYDFWGVGGLRQKVTKFGYDSFARFSSVTFYGWLRLKSGYDMATIFQGWGVPELLATIWLRYSRVGGSTIFFGYVVFGQPLIFQ